MAESGEPHEFVSGKYNFVAKILEVKDLAAKDANGTSDPAVYIQVNGGNKQFTTTKHSVLSAVFEEDIAIEDHQLEPEEIEGGIVRIGVVDADVSTAVSTDLIGCYEFDMRDLYQRTGHGYQRQWIGLINLDKPQDCNKVQGFCKLDIAMLAPGDKMKPAEQNLQAQMEAEAKAEAMAGGVGNMVLMPQVIQKQQFWLSMKIHAMDGISGMDPSTFSSGSSTDAVLSLAFGHDSDGKEIMECSDEVTIKCTKAVTSDIFDRCQQAKYIGQEIRLPVWLPSAAKQMRLGLWDYDSLGGNDCLGHEFISLEFKPQEKDVLGKVTKGFEFRFIHTGQENPDEVDWINLQKGGRSEIDPKWINFYGCNPKSGGLKEIAKQLKRRVVGGTDWKEYQNKFPAAGVCFKGRALVSFSLDPIKPKKSKKKKKDAEDDEGGGVLGFLGKGTQKHAVCNNPMHTMTTKNSHNPHTPAKEGLKPFMEKKAYHLRMLLVSGSEIPYKGTEISVMVSVGKYELHSAPVPNHNGYCEWNYLYDSNVEKGHGVLELPADLTQVPDVFVYLVNSR
jgi:hypothetical protein